MISIRLWVSRALAGCAAVLGLDGFLLECGRGGFLSQAPRRLALEVALAALSLLAALVLRRGARALCKPGAAFLFGLFIFCANTRPLWSGDTQSAFLSPFALIRDHTFALDGVACTAAGPGTPFYAAVPGTSGKFWSRYPIMTGLLALPLELPAALSRFDPCAPVGRDLEKVTAAILAALMLALLCSALRALVDEGTAALTLLAWTLGTACLPILGQALWQHTGCALGCALAVRALIFQARMKNADESRATAPGLGLSAQLGLGAGLVIACRPPDFPIALALFGAAFQLHRARAPTAHLRESFRALGPALLFAAPPLAIHFSYQWQAFGGPLQSGYGEVAVEGWRFSDAPLQFLGLLFSPGRGLLVWSPILLVALLPLIKPPRSPLAPALRILALGLFAQLLLIACWFAWHGGSTFGPRMHAGGLPLFAPLLALGFESLRTPRARMAAAALALASILPTAMVTFIPLPTVAREACLHLHAPGGAWSPLAWPPRGIFAKQ